MKLAISGKGGVGKTTLAACLAGTLAQEGRDVIALDADPDANLASALGVPPGERIVPLTEMRKLIEERTGAKDGYGQFFKLNPRVDDIPDAFGRRIGPIRLLVLGGVVRGGAGCMCPASALLKALLVHLTLGREDHLVMDMEAGIEHLGRATARSMDALIVVVNDPGWSLQTALRVRDLAADIGLARVFAVANRMPEGADLDPIRKALGDVPLLGALPYDPRLGGAVLAAEGDRIAPGEALAGLRPRIETMLEEIRGRL